MKQLRVHLLSNILSSEFSLNKYSFSQNNLKAVINLEKQDKKNLINKSIFKEFEDILKEQDNLLKKGKKVPLLILEQYYLRNMSNLSKEIYIEWENLSFEIKVSELYLILEEFFLRIYLLAVKISDYYNLEIKLKKDNINEQQYL